MKQQELSKALNKSQAYTSVLQKDIKNGEVFIQPVAAVGIGIMPQFNVFDESRYLTSRLAVEAVFKFRRREMWILEVGLFRAPKGQSDDQDITIGTMVYARVGYGYR